MKEPIGYVFGETSTQEFEFVFPVDKEKNLKNSFVVVKMENYEVIGRVIDIITENPLLSPETMKFFVEGKGIQRDVTRHLRSKKFLYFIAKCEVLGEFDETTKDVKPVTKPVESGAEVYFIDSETLEKLFFEGESYNLFPGFIETPNRVTQQAKFSLKGDEILTMHCGIFGMTGMGKTTTTGTLLEELTIRGAKSLIFDPHGDYVNLGVLKGDLLEFLKNNASDDLKKLMANYRNYLTQEWSNWLKTKLDIEVSHEDLLNCRSKEGKKALVERFKNLDSISKTLLKEMCKEIRYRYILFRLIMLMSVLEREIPNIDNKEKLVEQLQEFAKKYSFEDLKRKIPEGILKSVLKLNLSAFPSLELIPGDFDKYYLMSLIEAFSGEEITEAQEGKFLSWLEELANSGFVKSNEDFIEKLLDRAKKLKNDPSKYPIIRKLEKALATIKSLKNNGVKPLDSKSFVKEFSSKDGKYSIVSNVVFDLTEVSPETVQRALLYAVVFNAFKLYKAREISVENGDSQILFVIEEARVLIPKSGAENIDHPASKSARNIVRRVATEGRKMGLGLLIVSQKPSSVDNLPVSQCNTLILHRVINPEDLSFVKSVGESISDEDIENLKTVGRGVSIVTGTALKIRKSLTVRFRNRLSQEGREHPKPLKRLWGNG